WRAPRSAASPPYRGRRGSRASPRPGRCAPGRGGAAPLHPTGRDGAWPRVPRLVPSSLRHAGRGGTRTLVLTLSELLLDVRLGLVVLGLHLFLARLLVLAFLHVALLFRDVVCVLGLGFRDLALVAHGGVLLLVELGLGDLLLALGVGFADFLLVLVAHLVALR